jgi:predicted small metal-binding protein
MLHASHGSRTVWTFSRHASESSHVDGLHSEAYHPRQGPHFSRERYKMKTLTCRDVGVDCDFVAQGQTEEEVMDKATQHARKDHGFEDIPPELREKARAAIHDEKPTAA